MQFLTQGRLKRCTTCVLALLCASVSVWFYTTTESKAVKPHQAYLLKTIEVFLAALFTSAYWIYRVIGTRQNLIALRQRSVPLLFLFGALVAFHSLGPLIVGVNSAVSGGDTTLLGFAVAALVSAFAAYREAARNDDEETSQFPERI